MSYNHLKHPHQQHFHKAIAATLFAMLFDSMLESDSINIVLDWHDESVTYSVRITDKNGEVHIIAADDLDRKGIEASFEPYAHYGYSEFNRYNTYKQGDCVYVGNVLYQCVRDTAPLAIAPDPADTANHVTGSLQPIAEIKEDDNFTKLFGRSAKLVHYRHPEPKEHEYWKVVVTAYPFEMIDEASDVVSHHISGIKIIEENVLEVNPNITMQMSSSGTLPFYGRTGVYSTNTTRTVLSRGEYAHMKYLESLRQSKTRYMSKEEQSMLLELQKIHFSNCREKCIHPETLTCSFGNLDPHKEQGCPHRQIFGRKLTEEELKL